MNTNEVAESKPDFRAASTSRKNPKAVADGIGGIIIAIAEIRATPEQVFNALTTKEIEQWWKYPGVYFQKDWMADVRPCGQWSVAVQLQDGQVVHGFGEFCEICFPEKIVMTRRFDSHPYLGERETTITYRLQTSPCGALVTVRDEGFVGRSKAAYGNAEIWEKVLGWLADYFDAMYL